MNILRILDEMCSFIRTSVPNRHGLFRTEEYNAETRKWASDRCDPDDLGDFAPFMVWFDKVTKRKTNTIWVEKQFGLLNSLLKQKSGFYYPFSDGGKRVKQSNILPAYPQNHFDLPLGLNLLYRLTGNKAYYEANRGIFNAIRRYALSRKGFLYGSVIPGLHLYFPRYGFMRHKPQIPGTIIEELVNFYELGKEKHYLNMAARMAGAWLNTKSFRRYGLFPDQVYPYINKEAGTATISKENVNMVYGLIRLYRATNEEHLRDAVTKALKGLSLFRTPENAYYRTFDLRTGRILDRRITIVENHGVLGALLDAYLALGDSSYLRLAERGADFWIKTASGKGLFQELKKGQPGWDKCEIHSHSDFLTIVARLYLLTKKKKYASVLARGVETLGLFKGRNGFCGVVDYRTGRILHKENELKLLGDVLKYLLSTYTLLNKTNEIDKETLNLLMRDR